MVVSKQSYEDLRKQRLEENQKRMEQLNLPQLTQALKTAHSPKPSPMKRTKPRAIATEMVEVRRSSRVASLPAPVYKEIVVYERIGLPKSGRKYSYSRKDLANRVYASDEAREYATNKAEELESKLEGGHPSFVKPMLQSHVTGGFWLGLPGHFCRKNLPKNDGTVTLIDEDGEEFPTVYLARKAGLSGGWRGFSISHELVDGDALVFHLIQRTVFKVYIIRNKDYYAEDENNDGSDA
ncbi:B3 domain-containing protein Os06g0194400-like [Rutidosis leptorrhynchoides]|uniref:B3 domain-containing protein Os06g0194400-like n=1 Tax=Rutidosis leptorrhynchoides TaxID=125765 RepID=UPI003A98CE5C